MIASMIDHTVLSPVASAADIERCCEEAVRYQFGAVCVATNRVALASKRLLGTGVKVATVVGFPHGNTGVVANVAQACQALIDGASEVDMVVDIGALLDGDLETVTAGIRAVKAAIGDGLLKVILETALLTDEQVVAGCRCAMEAGADFVKTSTGFASGGATIEAVRLMRKTVGSQLGVKASGGIRDYQTALAMIEAGANRLGVSAGVAIITEANRQ